MQEKELRKGSWLDEEDEQLATAVAVLGDRKWDALAKASGLQRSGKSCRLRWMNYLRPNLKHGNISAEEERIIVELHEKWGNKWSRIAQRLPGRTDNEIKNYWRSYLKRKKALVFAKESFNSSINTSSMRSECDEHSPCSMISSDILGPTSDSCDALELLSLTRSPYETRLTEWMSNWHPDNVPATDITKDEYFWDYDSCNTSEWISNDCVKTEDAWDISLWDGNY